MPPPRCRTQHFTWCPFCLFCPFCHFCSFCPFYPFGHFCSFSPFYPFCHCCSFCPFSLSLAFLYMCGPMAHNMTRAASSLVPLGALGAGTYPAGEGCSVSPLGLTAVNPPPPGTWDRLGPGGHNGRFPSCVPSTIPVREPKQKSIWPLLDQDRNARAAAAQTLAVRRRPFPRSTHPRHDAFVGMGKT